MAEPRFAYPIILDLADKPVLVVGGGGVALRKARDLADAGAHVHVVSPEFLPEFTTDERLHLFPEPYEKHHLAGARLVVAATNDEAVNARVAAEARAAGALVNVVDRPELCDFIVPAQVRRGELLIAISTGGASPMFARRLRERLEKEFGPEYEVYLAAMRDMRQEVLRRGLAEDVRRRVFERLAGDDLLVVGRQGPEALRRAMDAALAGILKSDAPGR
jgi:precorrin-2 dehydrogenase/sirohydrochlorin ferrochelatase